MAYTSSLRTLSFLYPKSHPHPCGKLILSFGTQAVLYRGFSSLIGKNVTHVFMRGYVSFLATIRHYPVSKNVHFCRENMAKGQ